MSDHNGGGVGLRMNKYERTRMRIMTLSAAALVFLMGTDTSRMPWGDEVLWFTCYTAGGLGLLHFAWQPSLYKFRWATIILSSVVTLRTIVHLTHWTPQLRSAIAYNGFFVLCMVAIYIQMRALGRVPERWKKE
jgi:hypothetical protein